MRGDRAGYPAAVTRSEFLASKLADLAGYWLEVTCSKACAGNAPYVVKIPCKLMASRGYGQLRVADMLPRLACKRCGSRPAQVLAMNHGTGRSVQYPDAWVETVWP